MSTGSVARRRVDRSVDPPSDTGIKEPGSTGRKVEEEIGLRTDIRAKLVIPSGKDLDPLHIPEFDNIPRSTMESIRRLVTGGSNHGRGDVTEAGADRRARKTPKRVFSDCARHGDATPGVPTGRESSGSEKEHNEYPEPQKTASLFGRLNFPGRARSRSSPPTFRVEGEEENLKTRSGIIGKILKGFGEKKEKVRSIAFDPGPLSIPSFSDSRHDLNITYSIEPPFQYVHIEFDRERGVLVYSVREPELSKEEHEILAIVQRAFEKQISTNLKLILGANREEYLKSQFYSIVHLLGLNTTEEQNEKLFFHLKRSYLGFGRIDTLMKDKYIEDISCNGPGMELFVMHRIFGSLRTDLKYEEVELNNFVLRLAQLAGRHISLLQPIRDISLPDGSRANLTLGSEVTKKGSTFTIRKFRSSPISPIELMDYGTVDASQLAYLWLLMEFKRSIIVSGGTATGKTTFLNCLCSFIPTEFKIVSIEDTAELNLMHPNWIQSVTRSGFGIAVESGVDSISGVSGVSRKSPGDVSLYDLLVAALRQRPEFIIVGEVRGPEAFTLFQAIAVGHAGLGTIHAGSMDELLARVESNPMNVPRSLFSNIDAVIFPTNIRKDDRNLRRVSSVVEVVELDRIKGDLVTNTAFKWNPEKDVFKYNGRSYLFDKIRETFGVSRDFLMKEWVDRTNLLLWLQKKGIRDYREVLDVIRDYYRDKAEVEKRIQADIRERLGM